MNTRNSESRLAPDPNLSSESICRRLWREQEPGPVSLNAALAAARFISEQSREFIALHEHHERTKADLERENDELDTRVAELDLLHFNCMQIAKGQEPRTAIPPKATFGYNHGQQLPKGEWPDALKLIYELRSASDQCGKERARADQAEVTARAAEDKQLKAETKLATLLTSLELHKLPEAGLLRSTRRAIGRILERYNKAIS